MALWSNVARSEGGRSSRARAPGRAGRDRAVRVRTAGGYTFRQTSSRCSIPFLETLPLVICSGIQSGESDGEVSSQAQAS